MPGRGWLKLSREAGAQTALGPASPHLALVCVAVRICLAPRSLAGVCWGVSPDSQNGYQSVCCHIIWVHSGRCLMEFGGFLFSSSFLKNSDLEVEAAGMAQRLGLHFFLRRV